MIITLTQANFSACSIGTLTTCNVKQSTVIGATVNINKPSVERGVHTVATVIATILLDTSNYKDHNITVMMGSADVTNLWYSSSTGTVTIPANTEIKSNITISVSATAIQVSGGTGSTGSTGSTGGDIPIEPTGEIEWFNQTYQSNTSSLQSNNARALARIPATPGDVISISGLDNYVAIDVIAIRADGSAIGYTSSTSAEMTVENGTITVMVPTNSSFTVANGFAYIGLTFKSNPEAKINLDNMPKTYEKRELAINLSKWDTKTSTFMSDSTRLALSLQEVKPNRTIVISNLPDSFSSFIIVDPVVFNADKTFYKLSTASTVTGTWDSTNNTYTITYDKITNVSDGMYISFTMKDNENSSNAIVLTKFLKTTISSN